MRNQFCFRRVQAQREDDDRDDVAHVAAEAEEIHISTDDQRRRRRGESKCLKFAKCPSGCRFLA